MHIKDWKPIRLKGVATLRELREVGEDMRFYTTGWIDAQSLEYLLVDDYQRAVLRKRSSAEEALENGGGLPSICIGMRGDDFDTRSGGRSGGTDLILTDPCFIIDGLQRTTAMLNYAKKFPNATNLNIQAEVRFNTTKAYEKKLFHNMNANRTPMSPNVLLRNARESSKSILTIFALSNSEKNAESFALHNKICWDHQMAKDHIVKAKPVISALDMLHRHVGGQRQQGTSSYKSAIDTTINSIERKAETVGLNVFRSNTIEFFNTIDDCWGIRNISHQTKTTAMRNTFMLALAKVLADHTNFWNGNRLAVPLDAKKKLSSLDIQEANFCRLAAAGTQTLPIVYSTIVQHFDKGKRIHHLHPRNVPVTQVAA